MTPRPARRAMGRRGFLQASAAGFAGVVLSSGAGCRSIERETHTGKVMTVFGPVAPQELGLTLPHEHLLVDFIGAAQIRPGRYQPDAVFRAALPHLREIQEQGVRTFVDATPAYLGRDALLLQRLSVASQLHLITNTGYYGASNNKFLPAHAFRESPEKLARRWLREWYNGIEGTGTRPGFIKIGVDAGPLSELHLKLLRAAALTHQRSGLTIASHTGNALAAFDQISALRREGVDPSAWIWVHAQNDPDLEMHFRAAEQGAWIELDGIAPDQIENHVRWVGAMRERGLLGRVLVSQDAGWYNVGTPDGGAFRSFSTLVRDFIPALRAAGFKESEIHQLTVENPREAFTIRVRLLTGTSSGV